MSASLLIEIGVEELPPKAMQPLAQALARGLAAELDAAGVAHGEVEYFATPRRLTARITDTAYASAAETVEKTGPTVNIAFDDSGRPTRAGEGFARSVGVPIDALETVESDKGPRLVFRGVAEGRSLRCLIQPVIDTVLRGLPVPKRMRWGDSQSAFVRPVHWVVALHGDQVLPLTIFGATADRYTRGHRFHHPAAIEVSHPDRYVDCLLSPGYVIVDIARRRSVVAQQITTAAGTLSGQALVHDDLVDEVVALVEWPVGVAGGFDEQYLRLPREVLIATLEGHQRYFPVTNAEGVLIAGFVTVANIASRDPAQVASGNERVVRPRLADALFFWEQDRRRGLAARLPELARVSFQQSLGSLSAKSERIRQIALGLAEPAGADRSHVERAAELAKADLVTDMVDEFPELQGTMGGYYAASDGEPAEVARAIAEHYSPSGAGAPIAESAAGRCVALADRIDTLAGIFAINQRPSGDKDPYGLRRAALGILRTLIEGDISADLSRLIDTAVLIQPIEADDDIRSAIWMFHMERLRGYYQEHAIPAAHFDAIAALNIVDMTDFNRRIRAVGEFATLDAAAVVCGAHKRIRNILRRNSGQLPNSGIELKTLTDVSEQELYASLESMTRTIETAAEQGDYMTALSALAPLARPLDRFFDQVMVMTDDPALKRNRLALLLEIDRLCRRVADVSCLSAVL